MEIIHHRACMTMLRLFPVLSSPGPCTAPHGTQWGTAEASVTSVTTQAAHLQPRWPLSHRPLQVEDVDDVSTACWDLSSVEDMQLQHSAGELMADIQLAHNEQAIQ